MLDYLNNLDKIKELVSNRGYSVFSNGCTNNEHITPNVQEGKTTKNW